MCKMLDILNLFRLNYVHVPLFIFEIYICFLIIKKLLFLMRENIFTQESYEGHRTETCYTQYVQTKPFLIKSWKISQKLPSQNNSHSFIHKIAC